MKIKLTLGEIYALEAEISGSVNQQNGEVLLKGLLSQELSLITKFKLNELKNEVTSHKESVDKLREELIKKLGEEDESKNISLQTFIETVDKDGKTSKQVNPKFVEFNNEITSLLSEEREIDFPSITIEDLDINTTERYEVLLRALSLSTKE